MSGPLTKNDMHRFSKLWAKAYPAVRFYVTSVVPDHHAVEDIVGRISEVLIEKCDQYDEECPFEAWAIGVARYEILSYRRDKARDRLLFDDDLIETIGDRCADVSSDMGPFEWALQRCLKSVTGRASRALDLRYGEDLRYEAIGRRLEMTAGAVRIMLHRTRETLRRCIERHVVTDTPSE